MPIASLLCFTTLIQSGLSQDSKEKKQANWPLEVGWHDELDNSSNWKHLIIDNKPKLAVPNPGTLRLTLGQVPAGWPYEYQWSGVTRRVQIDIAKTLFLGAYVCELPAGYAHMDIDVLDAVGKPIKTIRINTLQNPGVSFVNLRDSLEPGTYNLQLRLIVGGPNSGCSATYDWIRFSDMANGARMTANPNLPLAVHHRIRDIDFSNR